MKVSVLGSGNGGCAVAFEWAQKGHEVYLFDFEQFPENIKKINAVGGIYSDGEMEGFAKLSYAGHDIKTTMEDTELVFVVGPAYSTAAFAEVCKPYIKKGQIYVICPSSCAGSLVFKNALGLAVEDETVIIAETSTLPYAVRITGDAKITVFNRLKGAYFMAALPSKYNQKVYDIISQVHDTIEIAQNILQTTLQNANPIIHPSVTLLNAALIERTRGNFLFYEEGVTKAVGRVIEAMDIERIVIGKKLGVEVIPDPVLAYKQGYMADETYDIGFSKAPGFKGIKAQSKLDHRYLNEDAGYGLVFFTDLAKQIGVETPTMDSVIQICSVIMARDYKNEKARTMENIGLGKYSVEELKKVL